MRWHQLSWDDTPTKFRPFTPKLQLLVVQAVAGMDMFSGPHAAVAGGGKSSALTGGYPMSPLHLKRRGSSNSPACVGVSEDRLDVKGGGIGDDSDAGYLPQLRRSEGRGDVQYGPGC